MYASLTLAIYRAKFLYRKGIRAPDSRDDGKGCPYYTVGVPLPRVVYRLL